MAWPNICDNIGDGTCTKHPVSLFYAITRRGGGNVFWVKELSGREREISILVAHEFTNKQIGRKLDITELTVKTHLRNVYSKTGVHDKAQLVCRILKSEKDFWNMEYHKLMRRLHQAQDDKKKK